MTGSSLVALALSREGAIHRTISSYFPPSFKWQDGRLSLESFLKCPLFYYPSTGSRGMLGLLLEQVRQMRNCHHHYHPCSLVGNTWYHLKSSCLIYIFSASLSYLSWGEKKFLFEPSSKVGTGCSVPLSLTQMIFSSPVVIPQQDTQTRNLPSLALCVMSYLHRCLQLQPRDPIFMSFSVQTVWLVVVIKVLSTAFLLRCSALRGCRVVVVAR